MKHRILVLILVCSFLAGTTAYAHHSFAAVYNSKKEIKLEGNIVQLLYRNPHSYVQIEAPDEHGTMQRWSVEWGGAASLSGQGVQRDTFKTGDHVIITGLPSRTPGEYRVKMNTLRRPADGLTWGTKAGEVVD
jgi:DNA/RNA endonuclease YhcR with UshA esterase domain